MSVEIGKIIDVYDQTLSTLEAKNQLFIEDSLISLTTPQTPVRSSITKPAYQICTMPILKSYKSILKNWHRMYTLYSSLKSANITNIKQLSAKINYLKSNTDYLTKQQQLLTQIQSTIKQWSQIKDPLLYYDIKKRQTLKTQLSAKITQIKQNLINTKQATTPMYLRKLHQELKSIIYMIYKNQNYIDQNIKTISMYQCEKIVDFIYLEDKSLRSSTYYNYVAEERNQFVGKYAEILTKRSNRVSQNVFIRYNQDFNQVVKNIGKYWEEYMKSLEEILTVTKVYVKIFKENNEDFNTRHTRMIEYLDKPSETVNKIFKISAALKAVNLLAKLFQILPIINKFETGIKNLRIQVMENIKYSEQYRNTVVKQIRSREKQFYMYASTDDKNFLETSSKNEIMIRRKINECYAKFLSELYDISKESMRLFKKQPPVQLYQEHQIGSLLTKQIISYPNQEQKDPYPDKSQLSTSNSAFQNKTKNKKIITQKMINIERIENFVSKIQVFDSTNINWNRNNVFSCALGPRLLLHGKIVILQQGLYYESFFNKKNLFFGRTRLYIPKSQIFQIDTQNTLIIFPDAVEVKTKTGSVYFHSLSSRQIISNTLNQIYFPQNAVNQNQVQIQQEFNEYNQKEYQKRSIQEINQLTKPHQNVIIDKVFKNIKLNKFYRRYLSNDKFQIRGNTYENFKTYFMLQIQAIQPKSTPITPEHPSYFSYKKQQQVKNDPKISQRYHTYKKVIPKIPFLSSGGQGLCQDKQVYHWISPQILTVDIVSKVKGFSMIQNMQIHARTICKQQSNSVSFNVSNTVKFTAEATTNSLIKGPTLSNLKQSMLKMQDIIQKYEKGKKSMQKNHMVSKGGEDNQELEENIARLMEENKKLKYKFKVTIIGFVVLYLLTLIIFGIMA